MCGKFATSTSIYFSLDEVDILPEEMDPKFQGTESFETTMGSLGLTERHPIPDPVNFAEPDPLGSHTQGLHSDTDNVLAALSESHINPWNTHVDYSRHSVVLLAPI